METRVNLATLSAKDLESLFKDLGQPRFRARQVLRWIWKEGVFDPALMTNISKDLRALIQERFRIEPLKIVKQQASEDGTIKFLLGLECGRTVETVWIPREDQGRVTVCVSSQVGCKMGCTFCLTAQQKVERNLTAGEIAGQLLAMPNREKITNVVLMGMGEPFDNYDAVMGSIDLMTDAEALFIGPRRITVSTSGLVPAMRRFVKETKARLAVSLNASNDQVRSSIMPINKAYPLSELLGALREVKDKRFIVTFEYILIQGVNDEPEHARELIKLLRGLNYKLNLLMYNENPNIPYKRPEWDRVVAFQRILHDAGILNFIRTSRGRDISAACGQLASEHKREAGTLKPPRAFAEARSDA
jgi:23S rRNA (adenine2503-C2)-methyltransferase